MLIRAKRKHINKGDDDDSDDDDDDDLLTTLIYIYPQLVFIVQDAGGLLRKHILAL